MLWFGVRESFTAFAGLDQIRKLLGIAVWRKGCHGLTAVAIFRRIEKLQRLYASVWKARHAARPLRRWIERKPDTLRLDLEGATRLTACCALNFSAQSSRTRPTPSSSFHFAFFCFYNLCALCALSVLCAKLLSFFLNSELEPYSPAHHSLLTTHHSPLATNHHLVVFSNYA